MCSDLIPSDYEPLKCDDLPNMSYLMEEHYKRVNEMHEELIKRVIKQILKRDVVLEDAKRVTMVRYPGDIMDYDLAFDNIRIGRVVFEFLGPKVLVTFKPDVKYSSDDIHSNQ